MAGPSSSELNALIRLLEFLFSQEAALYTGTADPLSVAQQEMGDVGEQLTPLTDALMQSQDPIIAQEFVDLAQGTLDPISAKQKLYAEKPDLEVSWINSAVDDAFGEISSTPSTGGSSKKKTKYEEAFLPSPNETYMDRPELAPILPKAAEFLTPINKEISRLKSVAPSIKESGRAPTRSLKDVVSGVGKPSAPADLFPEVEDAGIKTRLGMMPRSEQLRLYASLQGKRAEQERARRDVLSKNAASLAAAGRSPLQDALMRRIAGLGGMQ